MLEEGRGLFFGFPQEIRAAIVGGEGDVGESII